jgi:hypothetical protein
VDAPTFQGLLTLVLMLAFVGMTKKWIFNSSKRQKKI